MAAGVIFFLSVVALGMAMDVRQGRVEAAEQALETQRQKDRDTRLVELEKANGQLKTQLQFESAKVSSTCDYIKSFSARYKLVLPPICKV